MILIFMRHGRAVDRSLVDRDEDRWLLPEGREEIELVLSHIDIGIKRIFTSPYRRAKETAEAVSRIAGVDFVVSDNLAPESLNIDSLKELNPSDGDMFISHSPYIETVISDLVGGCRLKLKPAGVAIVDVEEVKPLAGQLVLLVNPNMLARTRS